MRESGSQCDHIGTILKGLGDNFSYKSSLNNWQPFLAVLKSITFKQKQIWILLGNIW